MVAQGLDCQIEPSTKTSMTHQGRWSPRSGQAASPQDYVIQPGQLCIKGLNIYILKVHGGTPHTGKLRVPAAIILHGHLHLEITLLQMNVRCQLGVRL